MKFVKGVSLFLVLCFAAYGAYTLLKKPPRIDLTDDDIALLVELDIHVADGQADESGLASIFSVAPLGAASEGSAPLGSMPGTGSSVPPSFLGGSTGSPVPPPAVFAAAAASIETGPVEAIPRVAVAGDALQSAPLQSAPDFFMPGIDVLPPPNFADPIEPPSEPPLFEAPPFETPSFEVSPFEVPSVPATESPPLPEGAWGGADSSLTAPPIHTLPASGSPATGSLVSTESLRPLNPSPSMASADTVAPPPGALPSGALPSSEGLVRRIMPDSEHQNNQNNQKKLTNLNNLSNLNNQNNLNQDNRDNQDNHDSLQTAFVAAESVPVEPPLGYSVPVNSESVTYTQTAARHSLVFDPVRRENAPFAPVVAFMPPKQSELPQVPERVEASPATADTPAPDTSAMDTSAMDTPMVRQIVVPRLVENSQAQYEQRIAAPPALSVMVPTEFTAHSAKPTDVSDTLKQFVQTQRLSAESGDPEKIRLAFIQLSRLYEQNQLSESERALMLPILDFLALKVIYARDTHILESPYQVKPGETVASIAKDFRIPAALLRKINGFTAAQEVTAGSMLKVVVGQFDARISVQRKELTLLLGGLYAGRFPFTMPNTEIPARSGEFFVKQKTGRTAVLNNGWILGDVQTRNALFVFTDQDAGEIAGILSEMSVIVLE